MALESSACRDLSPQKGAPRRPLQQLQVGSLELSPAKRRRRESTQESLHQLLEVKSGKGAPLRSPADGGRAAPPPQGILLEVFTWLPPRELLSSAAPACALWRAVSDSRELWAANRRHLRLEDQLVRLEKGLERRSKGKLFRCRQLGADQEVIMRVVDLGTVNAGQDDGAPTSFLREVAALFRLRHPNIQRHFGADLQGSRVLTCSEFSRESFKSWIERLRSRPTEKRAPEIKGNFRQLLAALSHAHGRGVMHRNLKPDNVFIDDQGTVKLGDFSTSRMIDLPLRPYTPEDPKERQRSGREARRLWYRAPELILRAKVYGPEVDMWSVGCLLAEAATGRPAFQSDDEIDHLFRIFRLVGTPTASSWPEAMTMSNFSPRFPMYKGFDFATVARAASASARDIDAMVNHAKPDREDVMRYLLGAAFVLESEGMDALRRLLAAPPSMRATAAELLQQRGGFFGPRASQHAAGRHTPGEEARAALEAPRVSPCWPPAQQIGPEELLLPPAATGECQAGLPTELAWQVLDAMMEHESSRPGARQEASGPADTAEPALAPLRATSSAAAIGAEVAEGAQEAGADPGRRMALVDFVAGLGNTLLLGSGTLHLAVGLADRYLASMSPAEKTTMQLQVVAATCLKVADVFAEQSKEYYKQENATEYAHALSGAASAEQILSCEKDLLPRLNFDLHLATVDWFVRSLLCLAKFPPDDRVALVAYLISDLSLLNRELEAYPPSMRARCILVLAAFLGQSPAASLASAPPSLEHWNRHVRERVCRGRSAIEVEMCMRALVHAVTELRRRCRAAGLRSLEARHVKAARSLNYPGAFPVDCLAQQVLPMSQQKASLG